MVQQLRWSPSLPSCPVCRIIAASGDLIKAGLIDEPRDAVERREMRDLQFRTRYERDISNQRNLQISTALFSIFALISLGGGLPSMVKYSLALERGRGKVRLAILIIVFEKLDLKLTKSINPHLAHSLVLRTNKDDFSADMIFGNVCMPDGGEEATLEIYPRPDDTVYLCGSLEDGSDSSDHDLVYEPGETPILSERIEDLIRISNAVSPDLVGGREVVSRQACVLPFSGDGSPFLGMVEEGLYMSTGHGCWGILLAPMTGKVMAELIVECKTSFDVSFFQ
jgi:hypothetical protein